MNQKDNKHQHQHEEVEKLFLTLEDDSQLECFVVAEFEFEKKEYMALLPKGKEKVLLYEYREGIEGPELLVIEGEEEFSLVSKVYEQLLEE